MVVRRGKMRKQYLEENWKLIGDKIGTVDATVPGCVHTDLMNEGIIKDLFWRDNNKQYEWIENCDFTYTCLFDAVCLEKASLVFEGLDTYCDVYLNGQKIGCADDMFIPYEFDVSRKLKSKDNLLEVCFRSPVKEVKDEPLCVGAFTRERMRTRRIQCTYGWDWVDRFVTCGIYRPVYIKYGDDMHVDSAYILTENIDEHSAQICVELELYNYQNGGIVNVDIVSPGGDIVCNASFYAEEPKVIRRFDIENPELWYPLGYGEHPIYTLSVTVNNNHFTETFGIRTLKILQIKDKEGSEYYNKCKDIKQNDFGKTYDKNEEFSGFQVIVNGKKILCHGGNWVPCEPFPSAETKEKFDKLLYLAKEMNVNMLRVWGGGIFENKYFYDSCDRAGILVLQDFLMACGTYPENEDWFIEKLRQESEFAVKYLRNHPCLAWWHGDNENATKGNDMMGNYCGRTAALKGLAPAIYEHDRGRVFLPSSPYGGDMYASITKGTTHNTNYVSKMYNYFLNQSCEDYKEFLGQFTARFISEEPTFGAVSRKSALKFMTEGDIADENQGILSYHTKNNPCLEHTVFEYSATFALKVLGEAENSDDRYFKYKYIQYEWVRIVFENLRRNIGFSNGLIFWMYNDCWPASLGWAFVDYYCMPKASFYAFKRLSAHNTVSVEKQNTGYTATVSNSLLTTANVKGKAYKLSKKHGLKVMETYEFTAIVDGYSAKSVSLPWDNNEDNVIVCDIESASNSDRSFYKDGNLYITDCADKLRVVKRDENSITVVADSYIHVVEFEGESVFSDNCFTMLEGEERNVTFSRLPYSQDDDIAITAYTLK